MRLDVVFNRALPPRASCSPSVTFVDPGLEDEFLSVLSRRTELTVVELVLRGPSVCLRGTPEPFVFESHARPAAFDETGGAPAKRPPVILGDPVFFLASFGPLNVVSITRPPFLSGLGVLDGFVAGTGNVGGGGVYRVGVGAGAVGGGIAWEGMLLNVCSVGESDSLVGNAGRSGRGGG